MTDLIGQSFSRYHILEQLGEGGMATVYKAYDTRLETDVAVKVIRTDNLPQNAVARALKRFEREAKALARLTHPNIVSVTDYGEYDGKPYLVMKYLPGGTLKQRMGKPIPWQEAIRLLLPIAEALDYAHSQNMIHRDVKPSNILLTQSGQPMLTDFGIAKVLDVEETLDLTGTSAAVGTPEYMAPEQATAKTADHRADIYALGVVLYEMITGRKPFVADTPLAVLIMHAHDPLPSPKKFISGLPDGVEKLLIKTLAKRPDDRFQSMQEMLTGLGKLLGSGKQPEKTKKEKAEKSKAIEEKPARRNFPTDTKVAETQTGRRKLGSPVTFWAIGAIAITFIIGLFAFSNWNNSPTSVPTFTPASSLATEWSETPTKSFTSTPAITPTSTNMPTSTALPTELMDTKGVIMKLVAQGEFTMGSNRKIEQQPISKVILDAFYIDKFEVSNSAYKACVDDGACQMPKDTSSFTRPKYFDNPEFDSYPVIHIDWNMANTYCEWRDARLPTEAEWEKAARGTDERLFPWGGDTVNCKQANYKNGFFDISCLGDTAPIGSYEDGQSPYGVYDMAGNVAEWVADWYKSYPGNTASFSREERVVRGGSWFSYNASLYTSYRSSEKPNLHTYGTGFRCALSTRSTTEPEIRPTSTILPVALTIESTLTEPASIACDANNPANFQFISDVTIPDGTQMTSGQVFLKTWKVRNSGSCSWSDGYKLVFDSGSEMSGQFQILSDAVAPGQDVDISVQFTAPAQKGEYQSMWRMADASGTKFGDALFVQIVVK